MLGSGLGGPGTAGPFFSFSDGSAARIRSDFNRIRSDLYTQNRIIPFQNWAHTYNMKLRLQQEDGPITSIGDEQQTSAVLDRSEYESLTGSDQTDLYRTMASANHMTGNTWYSTECCAVAERELRPDGAGRDHQDEPRVRRRRQPDRLPRPPVHRLRRRRRGPGIGFSTAKVSFSNAWNRSEPYWIDYAATNDYFARSHMVLTQGAAKTDVAVYMRNYSAPSAFATTDPNNRHWMDLGLQRAGYSLGLPRRAALPPAERGRDATTAGRERPGVQGADLRPVPVPDVEHGPRRPDVEAAQKILGYAKAGLPVIFVGSPTGTAGLPVSDDATLQAIVAQILAQPSVSQVASEADVPAKLAPARHRRRRRSRRRRRRCRASAATTTRPKTDYYWLYNQGVDSYPGNNGRLRQEPVEPVRGARRVPLHRHRHQPVHGDRRRRRHARDARGQGHAVHARRLHGEDHADRPVHPQRTTRSRCASPWAVMPRRSSR